MHPIELDATLKLAKSRLRSGHGAEAEAMYRQVLGKQPLCAEAVHFLGIAAMGRGKLPEALEMVRKSVELAPANPEYFNNLATVLGRMGRAIEALGAAQEALDLKPEFPEALGNKGVAMEQLGRVDEAIESYRRAAELRADHADAMANLGNALSRKGEHEEAVKFLRRVTELRPRSSEAWKSLGHALRRAGRSPEAVTGYRMAVELAPKDAAACNNLGAALQEAGEIVAAEAALRACLAIDPNHKDAHWNRGLALLAMGNWREGWLEYEWRRHLKEDVGQKRDFPQPVWQGSPLEGRTILVMCEQGLGDTIQFIRYVRLLVQRGAKVIVECQAKLRPLLDGLGREGDAGRGRGGDGGMRAEGEIRVVARGEALPPFDVHARLLTLPGIFDSTPEGVPADVPYLFVEGKRIERMREKLERCMKRAGEVLSDGDGEGEAPAEPDRFREPGSAGASPSRVLRVGLAWQGNTAHKGDRFRSIPLSQFTPLAQVEGVRLISLQKGFGAEQMDKHRDELNLVECGDPADTTAEALLDTAALMKSLDLVIAVDTSMAHLAGALGVATWVALPRACDWRWLLEREDTPWYPTMRLFRQRELGEWAEVIERMAEELEQKAQTGRHIAEYEDPMMPEQFAALAT